MKYGILFALIFTGCSTDSSYKAVKVNFKIEVEVTNNTYTVCVDDYCRTEGILKFQPDAGR